MPPKKMGKDKGKQVEKKVDKPVEKKEEKKKEAEVPIPPPASTPAPIPVPPPPATVAAATEPEPLPVRTWTQEEIGAYEDENADASQAGHGGHDILERKHDAGDAWGGGEMWHGDAGGNNGDEGGEGGGAQRGWDGGDGWGVDGGGEGTGTGTGTSYEDDSRRQSGHGQEWELPRQPTFAGQAAAPPHPPSAPAVDPAPPPPPQQQQQQPAQPPHDRSAAPQHWGAQYGQHPPASIPGPPPVLTSASQMANRGTRTSTAPVRQEQHERPGYYWGGPQADQASRTKPSMPSSTKATQGVPSAALSAWGQPKQVDPWGELKAQPNPTNGWAQTSGAPPAKQAWEDWGKQPQPQPPPQPHARSSRAQSVPKQAWEDWGKRPQPQPQPHAHSRQSVPSAWAETYDEDEYSEDESDETYGAGDAWGHHAAQAQSGWGHQPQKQPKVTFAHMGSDDGAGTKNVLSRQQRSDLLKSLLNQVPQSQQGHHQQGHSKHAQQWGHPQQKQPQQMPHPQQHPQQHKHKQQPQRPQHSDYGGKKDKKKPKGQPQQSEWDAWGGSGGGGDWGDGGGGDYDGWGDNGGGNGKGWDQLGGDGNDDGWGTGGGGGGGHDNSWGSANEAAHGWGAANDGWGDENDFNDGNDGWGAEEHDPWGDPRHRDQKPKPPTKSIWGGSQAETTYSMPSKTLTHAYNGTHTKPMNVVTQSKMNDYTNVKFVESRGMALEPVKNAIFGKSRKAKDRIHWMFSPNKDERVSSLLAWIQAMEYNLGSYGLHKFLQSRERGALLVNANFRAEKHPNEPAFDWLTFDQLRATMDRILQESVVAYDPAVQVIIFVFLPSGSGNSVAMWRRKILVPNNTRLRFQQEIALAKAGLRKDKDYVVHLDELPPKEKGKGVRVNHKRGQSLPAIRDLTVKKKKRKWWQILRFED